MTEVDKTWHRFAGTLYQDNLNFQRRKSHIVSIPPEDEHAIHRLLSVVMEFRIEGAYRLTVALIQTKLRHATGGTVCVSLCPSDFSTYRDRLLI